MEFEKFLGIGSIKKSYNGNWVYSKPSIFTNIYLYLIISRTVIVPWFININFLTQIPRHSILGVKQLQSQVPQIFLGHRNTAYGTQFYLGIIAKQGTACFSLDYLQQAVLREIRLGDFSVSLRHIISMVHLPRIDTMEIPRNIRMFSLFYTKQFLRHNKTKLQNKLR